MTGRRQKHDVIAYQIRQSFKPGEVTPEEANRIGYELGMRFTKGKHAFIVATHTDRAHIHNHIIFNSTSLDCTRKFKDSHLSELALQRVSDRLRRQKLRFPATPGTAVSSLCGNKDIACQVAQLLILKRYC